MKTHHNSNMNMTKNRDKTSYNHINLKMLLQEPIAPYFTNTYNTLLSVVQGLALGFLFYKVGENLTKMDHFSMDSMDFLLKFILVFGMIGAVWHRYVIHDQYLAWRLGSFDTIILLLFALVQFILVFLMDKNIVYFSITILAFYIVGLYAYIYAKKKNSGEHANKIFKEHFKSDNTGFYLKFLKVINDFETNAVKIVCVSITLNIGAALSLYYCKDYDIHVSTLLYFFFEMSIVFYLFIFDLQWDLKRADSLKPYNIPW